jgi:hypothetical protein
LDTTNGIISGWVSAICNRLEFDLQTPVEMEGDAVWDHYEAEFKWAHLKGEPDRKASVDVPALKEALREQLSLNLIETNLNIEMLVVEKMK